jgi:hypothetical protein
LKLAWAGTGVTSSSCLLGGVEAQPAGAALAVLAGGAMDQRLQAGVQVRAVQVGEVLIEREATLAHASRRHLVAMQHAPVAVQQPERGGVVVQQQVAFGQLQLQVVDLVVQFGDLEQVRANPLQQGVLTGGGRGRADLVEYGQIDARIGLLLQLDAGEVMQPEGDVELLIIRIALDALGAEIYEVVVPVPHAVGADEVTARIQLAVVAVVDVDPGGVAQVEGGVGLGSVLAVIREQQQALLSPAGRDQPL